MIKTYSVLAGRYRGKGRTGPTLTHALDSARGIHGLGATLCGKFHGDALTESEDLDAPATCPTCAKRDPRSKTGGPFILSSLLQFR